MNQELRGRFGIAENGDTSVLAKIVQSGIAKLRHCGIFLLHFPCAGNSIRPVVQDGEAVTWPSLSGLLCGVMRLGEVGHKWGILGGHRGFLAIFSGGRRCNTGSPFTFLLFCRTWSRRWRSFRCFTGRYFLLPRIRHGHKESLAPPLKETAYIDPVCGPDEPTIFR
jgi:hypothetical protein